MFYVILRSILGELCPLCHRNLWEKSQTDSGLCVDCQQRAKVLTPPLCKCCGTPLISEIDLCLSCRENKPAFKKALACFMYAYPFSALMRNYKKQGGKPLARFFVNILSSLYRHHFPQLAIVPIPSHRSIKQKRGFQPSLQLSQMMAASLGQRVLPVLRKVSHKSQKTLSFSSRHQELKGQFVCRSDVSLPKTILLLDDVMTTGASAHFCAEVLKNRGVHTAYVLTVMRQVIS